MALFIQQGADPTISQETQPVQQPLAGSIPSDERAHRRSGAPQAPTRHDRDRTITLADVRAMLRALGHRRGPCRSMSQAVARVFLFALRTGMRAGEICGLTLDRVHADHVSLPVTKTRPRLVPLEPRALRLVASMRGWAQSAYRYIEIIGRIHRIP